VNSPSETVQIFVPLKLRKKNGRPKIMPPADYLPSEDQTQAPHVLRAIGRAWSWRRRMEAGEFGTVQDLASAVGVTDRFIGRHIRLAYLAPEILKRLVYKREIPAITLVELGECIELPWAEQADVVFSKPETPGPT
jgi:hypothetical protein